MKNNLKLKNRALSYLLQEGFGDEFNFRKTEVKSAFLIEVENSLGKVIKKGEILEPAIKEEKSGGVLKERIESILDEERRGWQLEKKTLALKGPPGLDLYFLELRQGVLDKDESDSSQEKTEYTIKDNSVTLKDILEKTEIKKDFSSLEKEKSKLIEIYENAEEKSQGWINNQGVIRAYTDTNLQLKLEKLCKKGKLNKTIFSETFISYELLK